MSSTIASIPLFAFASLGYLIAMGIVAVAILIFVRSGKQSRISGCSGCLIALAILAAAGIGAVGCTVVALLGAGNEVVRHGPVRKIEIDLPDPEEHRGLVRIDRDEDFGESETGEGEMDEDEPDESTSGDGLAHLRITFEGDIDVSELSRWIREEVEGDVSVSFSVDERDGVRRTTVDFGLPVDRDELREIEDDLHDDLPQLELPRTIRIEIRDPGE